MSAEDRTTPVEYKTVSWLPGYRFGDDGSGWSCRGNGHGEYNSYWRRLKPSRRKNGFYRFDTSINGERCNLTLHELVCEAWNGPRPTGTECLFKDGDRNNLKPSNLEWGILPENTMDPSVEYRAIPECDGYLWGADGSGWTCWRTNTGDKTDVWRRMSPWPSPETGHLAVTIRINGKVTVIGLHHMICRAFHGAPPRPGMHACHDPDPTPSNCRADNLRWDTPQGNVADMDRQGRRARGERCGSAKLTEQKVQQIRRYGVLGPRKLAEILGMTHGIIGQILWGKSWTHIPWPEGFSPQTEEKPRRVKVGSDAHKAMVAAHAQLMTELALEKAHLAVLGDETKAAPTLTPAEQEEAQGLYDELVADIEAGDTWGLDVK